MKKIFGLLILLFIVISCNNGVIKKPKNLIDEGKMEDIIYDIAILEGIKTQTYANQFKVPTTNELLKSKYKIDSLTFSQNTQYYASDIENFKHLYDRVKKRMSDEYKKLAKQDSITNASRKSSPTQDDLERESKIEETGIVK